MVKYICWNIPVFSCDSDWFSSVDIPGLIEASRGYDTPMGNPHPSRGFTDPGRVTKSKSDEKGVFLILHLVQIFLAFVRIDWFPWFKMPVKTRKLLSYKCQKPNKPK